MRKKVPCSGLISYQAMLAVIVQFNDISLDHSIRLQFSYVQMWTIQAILEWG